MRKMKYALTAMVFTPALVAASPALADTTTSKTSAPFSIVDGGEVTSTLNFTGLAGSVTKVTLTLNQLGHAYPDDLVFGLVNETAGLGIVFMSGAGGSTDVDGVNLTFADDASQLLPESFVGGQITSGTYLPSNYGAYEFTFANNTPLFAGFNGLDGNGNWTLYADDLFSPDGGEVAGGWTLNITTDAGAVPEPATWAMMIGGFGMVGGAMRRRNAVKASFA